MHESDKPMTNTNDSAAPLISLNCQEKLETDSLGLFEEVLDGAWKLNKEYISLNKKARRNKEKEGARFRTELDEDDLKLIDELGQLSADKLMEYIRTLRNTSAFLGQEEAAQFARARCLNIFHK